MQIKATSLLITCLFALNTLFSQFKKTPEFVYIKKEIPNIKIDLRYITKNNFIGKPINGYYKSKAIISIESINALKKVQNELKKQGFSLIIYDAYRPQKAVNHFVTWAKSLSDTLMKKQYYPNVAKIDLFKNGYISSHSRHSSGSTIDLSIYSIKDKKVLDMGTPYDFFSPKSWTNHSDLTQRQKQNRMLLLTIMKKYGFRNYPKEWWHYTLINEPYRNKYFNFNVE